MRVPAEAGMNRFVWNLRYPDATRVPGMILWSGELTGPVVVPGTYQVKLTVDGKSQVQSFEVKRDPRVQTSAEDFAKQFDLLMKIRDKLTETHSRILEIREVRRQVSDLSRRLQEQPDSKRVIDAGRELSQKLTSIEEALYQTRNQSSQDPLNYPIRLNNKLAALAGVVSSADAAPTAQSYVVYEELVTAINAELQKLSNMMNTELVQFNELAREYRVPAVIIKQSVKEGAGQ
jgi:phage-related tail protein